MSAHWKDRNWQYVKAVDTEKPNYLRERFKAIRKEQEKEKKAQNVTPIKRKSA